MIKVFVLFQTKNLSDTPFGITASSFGTFKKQQLFIAQCEGDQYDRLYCDLPSKDWLIIYLIAQVPFLLIQLFPEEDVILQHLLEIYNVAKETDKNFRLLLISIYSKNM